MSHVKIPVSALDSLWNLEPKKKEDWMAEIEEIIEEGESCAAFICDQIGISQRKVYHYLKEMAANGILQKSRRIKIAGQLTAMYVIAPNRPRQQNLIPEPVARDWLVAAFFGDYKPCLKT